MPSTTALTWPTVAEITAQVITDCMGGEDGPHEQIVGLHDRLRPLLDLDAAPSIVDEADPPTLEAIGALSSTLAKLRFDLQYALDSVRDMERFRDAMALEADSRKEASLDA